MMGYYRSSWKHEDKTEYYALTQFEARSIQRHVNISPDRILAVSLRLQGEHSPAGTNRPSKPRSLLQ